MVRTLIAGLAVLSLACVGTADAATKKKKAHHPEPTPVTAPIVTAPVVPTYARTPGPVGAGPGECYTDEGYGRYWPCGAGRD